MALRSRDRGERETQRTLDEFEEVAGLRNEDGSRGAYAVEHLATFTVTRETGIVYPADGMRRLLQLEKTNGIWSQKMQLCVDGQWVLVMDFETGSIMERFPAAWVHSPTAFTSPEPGELYNNVVAFVVGPPSSSSPAPGADEPRKELHIFQCHDVAAQALVEELNSLKGGSGSGEGGRDFIIEREREREKESEIDRPHRQMAALRERDDASSTGSDRLYEQDIAILNRCFDDIEKFIARLQHAAAASRELERRRRGRNSNSNGKKAGDGMLALRGRPPPERDFVDVLQKFKLSFNLLARLRAHIHDPNAPELVHFLFTPLALIVDAAGDATPGLPSRVVQPLLTRDALNLLANCVTSKETELWHSLGDAWLIPREQWKTTVPPYQPVFMDGWTPDYQVDDQPLRRPSPRRSDPRSRDETGPGVYDRDEPDLYGEQYGPYRNARPPARGDSGSVASSPERETPYRPDRDEEESAVGVEPEVEDDAEAEAAWARSVTSRGGRLVRVTYPRTANNDKELTVRRGELLELLDDSRKWWRARNRRGRVAHVPHTIVAPAAPPATPHRAEDDGNRDWMRRERLGKKVEGTSTPSPPTPPPLPPPPTPLDPIIMIRNNYSDTMRSSASTISGGGDMQEELKAVLTLYQQRKNKLDIKKTPDIFIDQQSSPSEVEAWLQAKGFSEDIQRNLRISGQDLFALSRMQLERILGHEDGKRLYSQVLVQRNVSGYKTRSSSELQSILRKVREKVEVS